jgi:hypothetical protein
MRALEAASIQALHLRLTGSAGGREP